ncbi:hypothetical protein SDC9_151523 [bioreactor metagenome]|uniref:Uncharacterized protein n=1 Tax=bioreactor metagenome TaxID=1076179 RepID=A0A645ER26_9ZZZZ
MLAEFLHRQRLLLPENKHGNILRIGQSDFVEKRLVEANHLFGHRIERKTELVLQQQRAIVFLAGLLQSRRCGNLILTHHNRFLS